MFTLGIVLIGFVLFILFGGIMLLAIDDSGEAITPKDEILRKRDF